MHELQKWIVRIVPIVTVALLVSRYVGQDRPNTPAPRPPREEAREVYAVAEFLWLREQFEAKRFDAVAAELAHLQRRMAEDICQETRFIEACAVFGRPLAADAALHDEWVASDPDRHFPYLARATYLTAMAWAARGAKLARETTEHQFKSLRDHLRRAREDVERALRLEPKLMPAYALSISNAIGQGDGDAVREASRRAIEAFPASYQLHAVVMWALQPRWFGSHEAMDELAKHAQAHVDRYPALARLRGFALQDRAELTYFTRAYDEAEALYTKAIAHGEAWRSYHGRARVRFLVDRHKEALGDIERAIRLKPTEPRVRVLAAEIHLALADFAKAATELEVARRLDPTERELQEVAKVATRALRAEGSREYSRNAAAALEFYELALRVTPRDPDLMCCRAYALFKVGRQDEAEQELLRALEVDPRRFQTCKAFDDILFPQRRFDEILAQWDRFIADQPKHAHAYLERAGTHRHSGNMKAAVADLEKACQLGNKEACGHLEQLR